MLAPLAAVSPAHAATNGSKVVISEVYGGGGNSGATYKQDFVELYNPTGTPVDVSSMSVQYRSSSSAGDPAVVDLTGSVPSHGHYLVGLASGTGRTEDLPSPDKTGAIAMSASAGTVFLANQTTALASPPTGSVTADPVILDLVGFGTSNTFETSATKAPSNTTSVSRTATGVDTDVNAADFTVGTPPTPQNAGTVAPTSR